MKKYKVTKLKGKVIKAQTPSCTYEILFPSSIKTGCILRRDGTDLRRDHTDELIVKVGRGVTPRRFRTANRSLERDDEIFIHDYRYLSVQDRCLYEFMTAA